MKLVLHVLFYGLPASVSISHLTRPHRQRKRRHVNLSSRTSEKHTCRGTGRGRILILEDEIQRKADIEGDCVVDPGHVFIGQGHAQGLYIGF